VALVGRAASTVGCGLGDLIDSHDVVVRVNRCVPITRLFAVGFSFYQDGYRNEPDQADLLRDVAMKRCAHVGDNPLLYEIPAIEATDVDYPADVPEAERRLKQLYRLE